MVRAARSEAFCRCGIWFCPHACRTNLPPESFFNLKRKRARKPRKNIRKTIRMSPEKCLSPSLSLSLLLLKIHHQHFAKMFSPPKLCTNKAYLFTVRICRGGHAEIWLVVFYMSPSETPLKVRGRQAGVETVAFFPLRNWRSKRLWLLLCSVRRWLRHRNDAKASKKNSRARTKEQNCLSTFHPSWHLSRHFHTLRVFQKFSFRTFS